MCKIAGVDTVDKKTVCAPVENQAVTYVTQLVA
jgi:hypothetical protein